MLQANLPKLCILKLSDVTHISRVHRCALALAQAGYDVSVLSVEPRNPSHQPELPYRTVAVPVRSRALPYRFFLPVRAMEGFLRLLGQAFRARADVYLAHNWESLVIAYLVTRINGAGLVYNSDELEAGRNPTQRSLFWRALSTLKKSTEGLLCRRCDAVIAADYTRAALMQEWYGLEHVGVVRNIPLLWQGSADDRIRSSLNLSKDSAVLLYQGSIGHGRGIEICIEALEALGRENAHLVLLGFVTDAYRQKLESLAGERGVEEQVHFLAPVAWTELLDWTASADISMVLIENTCLSYYCAAPNKFYETIMVGVPYVASDFPEMRRVHETVQGGILVDPSNLESVVSAVEALLADPEARGRMGKQARAVALAQLNWETEQVRLLDIVCDVLQR